MQWTQKVPTVSGFYFWRHRSLGPVEVVKVDVERDAVKDMIVGDRGERPLSAMAKDRNWWQGPITPELISRPRYLLFAEFSYYPDGGWKDFVKGGDDLEELEAQARAGARDENMGIPEPRWDWWHIVDSHTGEIVRAHGQFGEGGK